MLKGLIYGNHFSSAKMDLLQAVVCLPVNDIDHRACMPHINV